MKRCKTCQFKPCRCEDLAAGCTLPGLSTSGWPIVSSALAVHPSQVAAANARNRRHGVNVTYRPDGKAVLGDRAARRRLLRLEGMHDNHGGYGD